MVKMENSKKENRSITGLRGLAALLVVCYHFLPYFLSEGERSPHLVQHGYLAVDLFFILSGMVLAMVHANEMLMPQDNFKNYTTFLKKRVARIYPIYFVILAISISKVFLKSYLNHTALPVEINLRSISTNLLLIQTWGFDRRAIMIPSWSLSTEVAAYFLFPILVILALRASKKLVTLIVAICVVMLIYAATGGHLETGPDVGYLDVSAGDSPHAMARCLAGFMFGLLAYRASQASQLSAIVSRNAFFAFSFLGTVLSLCFGMHDLVIYCLIFLLVLATSGKSRLSSIVLGNSVVRYLGVVSFSLYLTHEFLLPYFPSFSKFYRMHAKMGGSLGILSSSLILSICLASILYFCIEKPGAKLFSNVMKLGKSAKKP